MVNIKNIFSKLHKNKKGIALPMLLMIVRIMFLIVCLILVVYFINKTIVEQFNTAPIESEILITSLMYAPGGVSYMDPDSGALHPGIVDIEQLDSDKITSALYNEKNNFIAARIDLLDVTDVEIKTVYFNKIWYDNYEPMVRVAKLGLGKILKFDKKIPVVARTKKGDYIKASLKFEILIPKA